MIRRNSSIWPSVVASQENAAGEPMLGDQRFEPRTFRPFADDQQGEAGQGGHRLDDEMVALALDQMPDRDERRPVEAEALPRRVPVERAEKAQIDAVPQ